MGRKDKRAGESAMSFFSFQDIICCVTGILIFVTLMISMELMSRGGTAGSIEDAALESRMSIDSAQRRLARLKDEYDQIIEAQQALSGDPITQARIDALEKQVQELESSRRLVNQQRNIEKIEAAQLSQQLRDARRRNEELQKQLLALTQTVAREEARSSIPVPGGSEKNLKPVFLEVAANGIIVADFNDAGDIRQLARFAGADAIISALKWAETRNPKTDYPVLLVRAGAIEAFGPLRRELRARGFSVGWEAWPESKSIFSRKDAGKE
jgi:hypothetical protein